MKVFLIQLLSITFVLLITGSIQSVTADHSEPDQGIFKNEREIVELDSQFRIQIIKYTYKRFLEMGMAR